MILTRKLLLVDIFLTRGLSKSLAFCDMGVLISSPVNLICIVTKGFVLKDV